MALETQLHEREGGENHAIKWESYWILKLVDIDMHESYI